METPTPVSEIGKFCQAVCDYVNALDLGIDARVCVEPVYDPEKESALKVSVIPTSRNLALIARRGLEKRMYCAVGVQKYLGQPREEGAFDGMVALAESLQNALHGASIESGGEAYLVESCDFTTLFEAEHLFEAGVFTSVLSVDAVAAGSLW